MRRLVTAAQVGALALAALCGCGEGPPSNSTHRGDLQFELPGLDGTQRQGTYDFGAVAVGTSSRVTFRLANVGIDRAQVSQARFESSVSGAFFVQAPDAVNAGATEPVTVTFSPPGTGAFTARLVIENDGNAGAPSLDLAGTGQ